MRIKPDNSERENGLFRWDECDTPDPTKVCYTCRDFDRETDKCTSQTKDFPYYFGEDDKGKIHSPKNMRCKEHVFDRDLKRARNDNDVSLSEDELEEKIKELRWELEDYEDLLNIKKKFGPLVNPNPLDGEEVARLRQKINNEVDLEITYRKFYKTPPARIGPIRKTLSYPSPK